MNGFYQIRKLGQRPDVIPFHWPNKVRELWEFGFYRTIWLPLISYRSWGPNSLHGSYFLINGRSIRKNVFTWEFRLFGINWKTTSWFWKEKKNEILLRNKIGQRGGDLKSRHRSFKHNNNGVNRLGEKRWNSK
jgi:hypothetical protein